MVVRFKIGANMNLAAANPGQLVGDDLADLVVNFGFGIFFSVASVALVVVFASRRSLLFVLLILS